MPTIDIEHLLQWVGREQVLEDPLPLFPTRGLAAALDCTRALAVGDALPPAWHWLYFLETAHRSATGNDGHPKKGGFLPPVTLNRRMWAAGSLEISQPLRLGIAARKRSVIRSVEHKTGKSGELVFVTVAHELSQEGKSCICEEQTLVYRAMPTERMPLAAGELSPHDFDWFSTFVPDPVTLFRFSALTFNAHRIHYDRDHATSQEFGGACTAARYAAAEPAGARSAYRVIALIALSRHTPYVRSVARATARKAPWCAR